MKEQSGHITSKVILGYILLITIAVCSVAYIYNIVEKVAEEDEPDHQARRKVYLVTNTLSLLYESEALGQLVGMPHGHKTHPAACHLLAQRGQPIAWLPYARRDLIANLLRQSLVFLHFSS